MSDLTDTFYPAEGRFHGYGAQLLVGDGVVGSSPQDYEALAEVTKIQFGDMTTAVFERTHLRSPDAHKEKLAGLQDSGPFTLECNYRPDHESQSNAGGGTGSFATGGLLALKRNRTVKDWILRLPYGSPEMELPFTGFVSNYTIGEIGPEDGVSLKVEITPTKSFMAALP